MPLILLWFRLHQTCLPFLPLWVHSIEMLLLHLSFYFHVISAFSTNAGFNDSPLTLHSSIFRENLDVYGQERQLRHDCILLYHLSVPFWCSVHLLQVLFSATFGCYSNMKAGNYDSIHLHSLWNGFQLEGTLETLAFNISTTNSTGLSSVSVAGSRLTFCTTNGSSTIWESK